MAKEHKHKHRKHHRRERVILNPALELPVKHGETTVRALGEEKRWSAPSHTHRIESLQRTPRSSPARSKGRPSTIAWSLTRRPKYSKSSSRSRRPPRRFSSRRPSQCRRRTPSRMPMLVVVAHAWSTVEQSYVFQFPSSELLFYQPSSLRVNVEFSVQNHKGRSMCQRQSVCRRTAVRRPGTGRSHRSRQQSHRSAADDLARAADATCQSAANRQADRHR